MKKWKINNYDEKTVKEISLKCDLSMLTIKVMNSRGYDNIDDIADFFNKNELSDPFLIKDMKEAVEAINNAMDQNELICIYGDYDCDGITATAILYNYLENTGANVMYYIPEREEGYGMNMKAIDYINDKGASLIITVDNGISALEEAEHIYELGMKLVVTDHHQVGEKLPKAEAVIDLHRNDCTSEYKDLSGVGVALKLCAALDDGNYDLILEQYADICAIGTIADVVPITGENRTIVQNGMMYLKNTENYGLNYLIEKSGVNLDRLNTTSIAFQIAPKINASGRFGSPLTAVKALLSEAPADAESYADTLITLNEMRKNAESEIFKEIMEYIDSHAEILNRRVIVISGKKWHHGVIGIVSARLLEKYGKPVILISVDDDGIGRGSARSICGFNIFKCLTYAKDLLEQYGGHECAGGLTLKEDKISEFIERVYEYSGKIKDMPVLSVECDFKIMPQDIQIDNIEGLSKLEPFGEANQKPVFAVIGAKVDRIVPLSQGKHTRLDLTYGNVKFQALMFNVQPQSLMFGIGDMVDIAAVFEINEYNGRKSISAKVADCRPSGINQEKYFAAKDCYERYMCNENIPVSYIKKMIPERAEFVAVYKVLNAYKSIGIDELYMKTHSNTINYCKLRIIIDAFVQTGLAEFTASQQLIKVIPVKTKVDLESSQVIVNLKELVQKEG